MKKLAVALLALLTPIAAAQDPSISSYAENGREYGNCAVVDSVDMFTADCSVFVMVWRMESGVVAPLDPE